jgi:hypothetical protein
MLADSLQWFQYLLLTIDRIDSFLSQTDIVARYAVWFIVSLCAYLIPLTHLLTRTYLHVQFGKE